MKKVENIFKVPKKRNGKKQKFSLMISVFLLLISFGIYHFWNIDIFETFNSLTTSITKTEGISLKKCIDGDTARFIVDDKEVKVRFSGINTPEYSNGKKEEYGKEAADYTCNRLTSATKIDIEWDKTQGPSHDREIGIIFVDGTNLNVELVKQGLADLRYLKDTMPYANQYRIALLSAQSEKLGLWS